jgi:hypothetical protein
MGNRVSKPIHRSHIAELRWEPLYIFSTNRSTCLAVDLIYFGPRLASAECECVIRNDCFRRRACNTAALVQRFGFLN